MESQTRQEGWSKRKKCDPGVRGHSQRERDGRHCAAGFQDGARGREPQCRRPLETEKSKETGSPLGFPRGMLPC